VFPILRVMLSGHTKFNTVSDAITRENFRSSKKWDKGQLGGTFRRIRVGIRAGNWSASREGAGPPESGQRLNISRRTGLDIAAFSAQDVVGSQARVSITSNPTAPAAGGARTRAEENAACASAEQHDFRLDREQEFECDAFKASKSEPPVFDDALASHDQLCS